MCGKVSSWKSQILSKSEKNIHILFGNIENYKYKEKQRKNMKQSGVNLEILIAFIFIFLL